MRVAGGHPLYTYVDASFVVRSSVRSVAAVHVTTCHTGCFSPIDWNYARACPFLNDVNELIDYG
jgi:hypothetical protein